MSSVWGGSDAARNPIGTGAKYNPANKHLDCHNNHRRSCAAFESHRDLGPLPHDRLGRLRRVLQQLVQRPVWL
jgi:hypothetical protein